jgi:hypothetical protein
MVDHKLLNRRPSTFQLQAQLLQRSSNRTPGLIDTTSYRLFLGDGICPAATAATVKKRKTR